MIDLFEIFDSIISQSRSVDVAESEFRKQLYEDEELLSVYKEWCEECGYTEKKGFIDPSLAVASLGTTPEQLLQDFKTFGFIFESLCIRDLHVYSSTAGGKILYYNDGSFEVDCILQLNDGRYALIEFKLGESEIDEGAKHLCEIERLINEYNKNEKQCKLRLPDLKIVITGTKYGYKRNDGVLVIPIGCLKN